MHWTNPRLHPSANTGYQCASSRLLHSPIRLTILMQTPWLFSFFTILNLKAYVSEEILNSLSHSLSLSADLCIHFYWLSWLRQASHRKRIQSAALRLRLWLRLFIISSDTPEFSSKCETMQRLHHYPWDDVILQDAILEEEICCDQDGKISHCSSLVSNPWYD